MTDKCNCIVKNKDYLTTLCDCGEREDLLNQVGLSDIPKGPLYVSHGGVTHKTDEPCESCDQTVEEFMKKSISCKLWCAWCEKYIKPEEVRVSESATNKRIMFGHKDNHLLEIETI